MVDTPLSQAPATQQRVLHDTRAILDAGELDAVRLDGQTWVVLRTTPTPTSGSGTVPGAFVDGSTGRLIDSATGHVVSPTAPLVIGYAGDYEIVTNLSGQPPAPNGQYAWQEPLAGIVRGLPRENVYHPFAQPGTVVGRYRPDVSDAAPFDPVYLIPDGWQAHVPEAVGAPGPAARADWLASANPLLSARALTALARDGQLDEPMLRARLAAVDGYPRALTHFLALRHAGRLGASALWSGLAADFASPDTDHRRAAALGLLTARLFVADATQAALGDRRPDSTLAEGDAYVGTILALLDPR